MAQEHTSALHNTSEIGRLRTVMLHRPGRELENLMPEYLERLLFDDIPYLKVAREEHDAFAECLRDNGVEVLYLADLVAETIGESGVREELIEQFMDEAELSKHRIREILREYCSVGGTLRACTRPEWVHEGDNALWIDLYLN